MAHQSQTEGAERALRLAAQLAAAARSRHVEPLHLLWALLLDESQATEMLAGHGVTRRALLDVWPLAGSPDDFEPHASPAGRSERVPESDSLASVVLEASRAVGLAGRHAALGTEHLLLGLTVVDSPARDMLARHALHSETISPAVRQKSGFESEPIAVQVDLDWRASAATGRAETLRILDAAANRAREGLRVLEDYVRFTLDDGHLTRLLKECRHELSAALHAIDGGRLVAVRDTRRDVGTGISTEAEHLRPDSLSVVTANFKRVEEALRSLEEFGKVVSPDLGRRFGRLRYELYSLEKAVLQTGSNRRRLEGRDLYLLVTEEHCHHGSGPAVREALAAGAGMVQVREKTLPDRKLLEHLHRVRAWTREAGALLIVNDRPDLAVLADADGVHVGQEELGVREARRIAGPDRLVGVSTHTIHQARQAVLDGADYLGVGPVFPSATKDFESLAGLDFVREVAAEISLPWFAIGGIDADNVSQVLDAGATRVALSGAICRAEHPGQAAAKILQQLDRHGKAD